MSDDQENVDRLTETLLRSQTARELEIHLRRLRKARGVLQCKKKPEKETGKQVPQMELKLPDIHSTSTRLKSRRGGLKKCCTPNNSKAVPRNVDTHCVSRRANFEGQNSIITTRELDLSLRGNTFNCAQQLAIEPPPKSNIGSEKHYDMYFFEYCEKGKLPVLPGPYFSPWLRVKKEKRKLAIDQGHFGLQEANVGRFYCKQQRPRSGCFNFGEILSEVSEINGASESQAKEKSLSLTASYKILCPEKSQEKRKDWSIEEPEKVWTVPKKVIPVKKEQRLKKLLRRKLISCYDLGPVMEPFDVIVGEKLNRTW